MRAHVIAAMALAVPLLGTSGAAVAQRIPQLAEDGTAMRRLDEAGENAADATRERRICEPGARWIRLGFDELVLNGYDSLVVQGDRGTRYTFEGAHWNGRSFSARALEGECVDVTPYFRDPASRYAIGSYQYGTKSLQETPVVVAGAGDLCDILGACAGTSDLIVEMNPTAVFTAGDNAYQSGAALEFALFYAPYWGRFKDLTSPAPGNHEYNTADASGYFDYFNGTGQQTGPAGDRSRGYYSWDVGDWHFIALNSMSGGDVAEDQLDWLEADLAANTKPCTAAYWHHPLVSVGNYRPGNDHVKPFWDRLYAAHADLVLVGHDHNYQRYLPMTPEQVADPDGGIVQVLVGTGGASFYSLQDTHPLLAAGNDDSHGVLKLILLATGYVGEFMHSTGSFTDTFVGRCHNAAPASPDDLLFRDGFEIAAGR